MDASQLRRGIGYVIQHAGLFPHKTILDNVATVPMLLGERKTKARSQAMELLERVGLPTAFAGRYPSQLSGGQQQRVGVARALAADPPVMLMDEPFSAVDPIVREQLQDEFLRLQQRAGQDHPVRHPRHRRGDQARRPGRRPAGRWHPGPARRPLLPAGPPDRRLRRRLRRTRPRLPRAQLPGHSRRCRSRQEPSVADRRDPGGRPPGHDRRLGAGDARTTARWAGSSRSRVDRELQPEMVHRGGTVASASGPLRNALDAALSSPSRRGVIVDDDGTPAGHGPRARGPHRDRGGRPAHGPRGGPPAGGTPVMTWFLDHRGEVLDLAVRHLYLAGVPLLIGLAPRAAAGLAGPALPAALPAADRRHRPALHDPLAGAVHPHAAGSSAPRSSTRSTSSSR